MKGIMNLIIKNLAIFTLGLISSLGFTMPNQNYLCLGQEIHIADDNVNNRGVAFYIRYSDWDEETQDYRSQELEGPGFDSVDARPVIASRGELAKIRKFAVRGKDINNCPVYLTELKAVNTNIFDSSEVSNFFMFSFLKSCSENDSYSLSANCVEQKLVDRTYYWKGVVVDRATQKPLQGVRVTPWAGNLKYSKLSTLTNSKGEFEIKTKDAGFNTGDTSLIFERPGKASRQTPQHALSTAEHVITYRMD